MRRRPPSPSLYDHIGVGYDQRRRADPRIVEELAALLAPAPGARLLDLACGTANYTRAFAARGGRWTGIDGSGRMLAAARERSPGIALVRGDAHALPFAADRFDGVLCTLAVHHFADRVRVFAEVRRVLRGGPLVAFVCDHERTQRFWLRAYFPEMFARMAGREPSEAEMRADLERAGFARVETLPYTVTPDLEDHFLYVGKHRPELYFEPEVRASIWSFANLCEPSELEAGLARLGADLDSGRFETVRAEHAFPDGDYLFLRASP